MLTLTKAIGILLTPPGGVLVLALLGLLLQWRWRRLGMTLVWVGVTALFVLSLPATGYFLIDTLENRFAALATTDKRLSERADAIVVLGGGRSYDAPEYGGDTVNDSTLERLRYGARLHRTSGLPLLVTGGSVFGEDVAEAELMRQVLQEDFHVPVAWVEPRSRTTYENAAYTRATLAPTGVRRIVLVTQAYHMPRAVWAFQHVGMEVIPAPTGYTRSYSSVKVFGLLPSLRGLSLSSRAAHEWLGFLWYRLTRRAPAPESAPLPERKPASRAAAMEAGLAIAR